jgi:alkaline phosphatase D
MNNDAKLRDVWWFDLFHQRVSRRDVLRLAGDVSVLIGLGALGGCAPRRLPDLRLRTSPFAAGVASGDPLPDGIVLWTRLASASLMEVGAHTAPAHVAWEIARDDGFRYIVRQGTALALPELGHSVHAEVAGLQPGTTYWYRFHAGGASSPVGRTNTAPALTASPAALRFAFVSCQNYEHGYFTAFRHLAEEELELVVHLGDYIYERSFTSAPTIRPHEGGEVRTLEEYRARYAHYRADADLQAAHAAAAWIVTTDDHEVVNNYANSSASEADPLTPEQLMLRRAAGYQSYYEFMPLRRASLPRGPLMQLFRRLDWGRLARFHVLDTRQYRTDQPCGDGQKARCAEAFAEAAQMLGGEQENWLYGGMRSARAHWNVLANQVPIAQLARNTAAGLTFSMDKWDGYVAARKRLLDFLAQARPAHPIVLTGDIHSSWVADLKQDFDDPKSATLGTEFMGTSMSSGGDGRDTSPAAQQQLEANPHIHFHNAQRGYVRCTVTPTLWSADYRVLPFVTRPGAPVSTRASFVVESGLPGVRRADTG